MGNIVQYVFKNYWIWKLVDKKTRIPTISGTYIDENGFMTEMDGL